VLLVRAKDKSNSNRRSFAPLKSASLRMTRLWASGLVAYLFLSVQSPLRLFSAAREGQRDSSNQQEWREAQIAARAVPENVCIFCWTGIGLAA
jgi:hypothetical protein